MGNVQKILIIGDYARGIDSGNIEVILVGKNLNFDYISQLELKVENLINRKVSFFLTSKSPNSSDSITLFEKK